MHLVGKILCVKTCIETDEFLFGVSQIPDENTPSLQESNNQIMRNFNFRTKCSYMNVSEIWGFETSLSFKNTGIT